MGNQMCCFVLLILVVGVFSSTSSKSSSERSIGKILNKLTGAIGRLHHDVARCEANLTLVKQSLDEAKRKLKKCEVANDHCQLSLMPSGVKESCAAWKLAGRTKSGFYKIDPDNNGGLQPFKVECVMNDDSGKVVTIFHHDSEARTNAGNCDEELGCVKTVTYQASMDQIASVIKVSSKCKQFIKFDCFDSVMFYGSQFGGWYSRDGALMDYWGGATPGSRKCACGMTNSCVDAWLSCNCDKNDAVWRSDYGYLRDKSTLPVSKMAFGDLGGGVGYVEEGYYRLGPLKCYN